MNQSYQLVIEVVRGSAGNPANYYGDYPVSELADDNENRRNDRSLENHIGADQLCELLDPGNKVVQQSIRSDT